MPIPLEQLPLDSALDLARHSLPPGQYYDAARFALLTAASCWGLRFKVAVKRELTWLKAERSTLMFPLEKRYVSGYRFKARPWYNPLGYHLGVDYGLVVGTPVKAPFGGEVVRVQLNAWDVGNMVIVKFPNLYNGRTVWMRFMHLSKVSVRVGQAVSAGDLLGLGGSTGLSTGPHLHLDITYTIDGLFYKNINNFIDPEQFPWDMVKVPVNGDFWEEPASAPEPVVASATVFARFNTNLGPSTVYNKEVARMHDYLVATGHMHPGSLLDERGNSMKGFYGTRTREAVDRFQKAHGISATSFGYWWDKTRAAANNNLSITKQQ